MVPPVLWVFILGIQTFHSIAYFDKVVNTSIPYGTLKFRKMGYNGPVDNNLARWLINQIDDLGWTQRELARRAGLSHTTINQVISEQRTPTWDFCASVAKALRIPEDEVFRLAGLKPPLPPAVAEEREAMRLFRSLPGVLREVVLTVLRALAGRQDVAQTVHLVAEEETPYVPVDAIDYMIEQEAEELRRIWHEVHRLDPEAARRLMGIAVLQAEMVQSAAVAKNRADIGDESR
jgi:DNA-binding XRE family transcriptional regulator